MYYKIYIKYKNKNIIFNLIGGSESGGDESGGGGGADQKWEGPEPRYIRCAGGGGGAALRAERQRAVLRRRCLCPDGARARDLG